MLFDNYFSKRNLIHMFASSKCRKCHQHELFDLMGIKRILGECLLISSLPGKALRTLVGIARLAQRFDMRSQSRAW